VLEPRKDRFDYGEALNAPDGFMLSAAIATTYTLDLDTLLAVSVALGFKDSLEGDLSGEKLVLLEAISGLRDKLKVFYEKGKITIPSEYNFLFTLLEPCVLPVIPEGGEFSSFHPKVWLLRYEESEKKRKPAIRYKLIVLTRNMTFDKSWDIAASIDGIVTDAKYTNNEWGEFFIDLIKKDKDYKPGRILQKELPHIKWSMHYGWSPILLPGGGKFGQPLDFKKIEHMLVVSPFIKDAGNKIQALQWLEKQVPDSGRKLLFSRAEELNAIGEEALSQWKCYAINQGVVEGEEKIEEGDKLHNLHAKLIVTERGNTTDWHVGSANATSAALGNDFKAIPRNSEFMLRFSGTTESLGIDTLLEQWGVSDEGRGLFQPHIFEPIAPIDEEAKTQLRSIIYKIVKAKWHMKAMVEQSNYILSLSVESEELFESIQKHGVTILVDQLAIQGGKQTLASIMSWSNVDLTQISAFIPVYISLPQSDIEEKVVIQVPLEIEGGDMRHESILKKMLDSQEKVLNYIRMLLAPDADKNEWLAVEKNHSSTNGAIDIFSIDKPIFEQLMYTASRNPEALERLELLIRKLEKSDIKIPEDFKVLWEHFRVGVTVED